MRAANTPIFPPVSTLISSCQRRTQYDMEDGVVLGTDQFQDEHYFLNTDTDNRPSPNVGNLCDKYRAHGMIRSLIHSTCLASIKSLT